MHPIFLIPLFLIVALVALAIQVTRERMPKKTSGPRPLYFVKHPDGSFTEADPQPFGRSSLGRAESSTAGPSTPDATSSAGTPTDRRST